jgi:RNA polymerase sigma factor (sigma-70 family)
MNDESFSTLLAAAQANAPWAFDELYRGLAPVVTGYLRMQGSREPEDLCSEVFLQVFRGIGTFEGDEAGFRSWVFTIAHRRLIDERRRLARRPLTSTLGPELGEPSGGDVEEEALRTIGTDEVRTLLETLSPDQRDVLLLRLLGGMPVDEVAAALGKRPGAVKALQRRGLAALQRKFSREGISL